MNHPSLTCNVDLDLKTVVLGDLYCGPLGDHTTLDCLWYDCPSGAGGGGAGVSTGVTGPSMTTIIVTSHLHHWCPQEVLHQLEPVKNEKNPQVVEDNREAGRVTCGPAGRWINSLLLNTVKNHLNAIENTPQA